MKYVIDTYHLLLVAKVKTPGDLIHYSLAMYIFFQRKAEHTSTMVGEMTLVLEYGARASRYMVYGPGARSFVTIVQ